MKVSIVVPAFNRCDLTAACIASVREYTDGDYELILVDNGSEDDTPLLLDAVDHCWAYLENKGFAVACNKGAAIADGDLVLFLNNDCEVTPGWLPPLVAAFNDPKVGAAGCRLIYPNGNIQHSGISFRMRNGELEAWNLHDELPSREVEGATGACLAVRSDLFGRLGGFDDGFWNGYDDVDLCLQVRASGYTVRYVAETTVVHRESQSGPERWSRVKENVDRLQEKWLGHPVVADVR